MRGRVGREGDGATVCPALEHAERRGNLGGREARQAVAQGDE